MLAFNGASSGDRLFTQNLELALNVTYNPPHSASPQEDITKTNTALLTHISEQNF